MWARGFNILVERTCQCGSRELTNIVNDKPPYFQLTPECKLCIIAKPCNAFLTLGEIFISTSCPFKPEAKQLMLKPLRWCAAFQDPNLVCPLHFWLLCSYTFNRCFPFFRFLSGCGSAASVRLHARFINKRVIVANLEGTDSLAALIEAVTL